MDLLKPTGQRVPTLYGWLRHLYLRLTGRLTPAERIRRELRTRMSGLSNHLHRSGAASFLVKGDGDCFVVTDDGLHLYYNHSDPLITWGDGQSLDLHTHTPKSPPEDFILDSLPPGSTVFDVGANNGHLYALKIASAIPSAEVVAFEPNPRILPHLRRNVRENGAHNVQVEAVAVSDIDGRAQLTDMGASSYLLEAESAARRCLDVDSVSLDTYVKTHPISRLDLIKLDIEGREFQALHGARNLLAEHRPMIVLELDSALLQRSGTDDGRILSFLANLGYVCYRFPGSRDAVAVPGERTGQLQALLDREKLARILPPSSPAHTCLVSAAPLA